MTASIRHRGSTDCPLAAFLVLLKRKLSRPRSKTIKDLIRI
ncbi:hypothetical protein CKA32_001865 [Geitlerinema sp. FC II]|nr:hypothetical protein CKA32_001865 [Geitlerinema sp. FC II]